jgi:hypothetical protein
MRILFDNGTPRGVARGLRGHVVEEARARGWDALGNGDLLDAAEAAGFDVFVTTDRNIRYQQNLTGRNIAIVVIGTGRWTLMKNRLLEIAAAVNAAGSGTLTEVEIPRLLAIPGRLEARHFDSSFLSARCHLPGWRGELVAR